MIRLLLVRSAAGCLCVAVAVAIGLFFFSVPAAVAVSSPPRFEPAKLQHEVYSTRLRATATLALLEKIETHWQAEYAISLKALEEGHGTVVNEGTITSEGETVVEIGTLSNPKANAQTPRYVRHLAPGTAYYVRFRAKNTGGEAEETIELKTLPVAKPEIAREGLLLPPQGDTTFEVGAPNPHSAVAIAQIESNGGQTKYEFAYSTAESGPFEPCVSGIVTVAEDFAFPEVHCTGLKSETQYFGRVKAVNEKGEVSEVKPFMTETAKPIARTRSVRNITAISAHLTGTLKPQGSETHWHFEYEANLSKLEKGEGLLGSEGTVSQAQAEALEADHMVAPGVEDHLTSLHPATMYYVRLVAENKCAEGCGSAISEVESFQTSGAPATITFTVHAVHGESLRLLGAVDPRSVATSAEQTITIEGSPTGGTFDLTFKGQTTSPIAYNASAETVGLALTSLMGEPNLFVEGPAGGPYTVLFTGPDGERNQPRIEASASNLTPPGSITVATTQQGGEAYNTEYYFEYVSQEQFEKEGGFSKATSTSPVELGHGDTFQDVGADLAGLKAGETYRYRIVATNNSPGNPVVAGGEHTLTFPDVAVEEQPLCENKTFRIGLSGHLPDCRAYEQISPVNKEGTQEALNYGLTIGTGTIPGEDGNHFMYMSKSTRWGSGQAPYFFSREAGKGWSMVAGAPQPEAGFNQYVPQVFDPDLKSVGIQSGWRTDLEGKNASPEVEFKTGTVGGPYSLVSVPRTQVPHTEEGWVAASEDFSKLILGVEDHALLGYNTGTKQSMDLYEYSGGELHQVNVDSGGQTIGSCGARVVKGDEASSSNTLASRHAVSANGSRVFFEAAPNCGVFHLYMREAAAGRTLDVGAYRFAGANTLASEVLLEKQSGETREFFLYDTESASLKRIFSLPTQGHVAVSRDFTAIFLSTTEQLAGTEAPSVAQTTEMMNLYRYDISGESMRFIVQTTPGQTHPTGAPLGYGGVGEPSPDGRFLDFQSPRVAGLPGGGPELNENGTSGPASSEQLYRYDSVDNAVECISCASPFDPEPKLSVDNAGGALGSGWQVEGQPERTYASANGMYAFFETPSALVPQDVNGEYPPESFGGAHNGRPGGTPSNDVYEWRRDGVSGCDHLQGCVSLITPGTDGWLVSLLGTAAEGRDVFFYTSSQLLPQDNDTAGDFYDARIEGGFAEPVGPVECEGDACLNPLAAPIDVTPASLSFSGPGNPTTPRPPVMAKLKRKPRAKHCTTGKCKKKQKGKRARKQKERKSRRLTNKHNRRGQG